MSWIPATIISKTTGLRSALRRAGVTKRLSVLRPLIIGVDYEQRVDAALQAMIKPGDVVWDVGANVGLYSERFAQAVGSTGRVIAFEPVETTYAALVDRVRGFSHVAARMEALGSKRASFALALNPDPTSPVNSLLRAPTDATAEVQVVNVVAADELIATRVLAPPNIVKIDTEGFEEDVIWGMRETLRTPCLRGLMIEVHFALLEERGHGRAPDRISSMLRDAGFELKWVDPSHLQALRS